MTQKIKIAFIKYGGLGAGGTERWLQELAVALNKNKFDVDYFYTGDENTDRLHFMQQYHIKLIKCDIFIKFPLSKFHKVSLSNRCSFFNKKGK